MHTRGGAQQIGNRAPGFSPSSDAHIWPQDEEEEMDSDLDSLLGSEAATTPGTGLRGRQGGRRAQVGEVL